MLNGIIFIREPIISLDLQYSLSKNYKIVKIFKNIEDAPEKISDVDFIIVDSDIYQKNEINSLLQKIRNTKKVKLISMTSYSEEDKSFKYNHIELPKPFDINNLIEAIEQD